MEIFSILVALAISSSAFIVALLFFQNIWLKPGFSEIPLEKEKYDSASLLRSQDYRKIRNLGEMFRFFLPLLFRLESRYWIQYIGLDGYAYLYYGKQILKLFAFSSIISYLSMAGASIYYESVTKLQDYGDSDTRIENLQQYHELGTYIDCFLMYLFSIVSLVTIFIIKNHVREKILEHRYKRIERTELERLKVRSVHVRGVFPEDRKGENLRAEIQRFLDATNGGRILSIIIIPDFTKMIKLENSRKKVDNAHKLYVANEPAVRRMFFPKKFRQSDYYEKRLRSIDEKIEQELMKPIVCSGHAFICFDSLRARNYCLKFFKEDAKSTFQAFKQRLLNSQSPIPKRKDSSTFQKFDDEVMLRELETKKLNIFMSPIESPYDICWANLGGIREFFRLLINVVAFAFLIFLSTPESLLTVLQKLPFLGFFDASQYVSDDTGELGSYLRQIIKAFWILTFNQLLLFLINFLAYVEKHPSFTKYQESIFSKSLLYLTLNMLVIPAFTLATGYSLFTMLIYKGIYMLEVLQTFYFNDTGRFFIIILFQNGVLSCCSSLLRIGAILNSFGSTWLAYYQRNYLNDLEKWRKKESDVFSYGYLYAQRVTAFAIIITYSITTPGILLAGVFYFAIRFFVDGYNLLIVFKKEVDSGGQMIQSILKFTALAFFLPQVPIAISFGSNGYRFPCLLTLILMFITGFFAIKLSSPLFTEQEDMDELKEEDEEDTQEDVKKWEFAYRHPLLVPSDISTQKGQGVLSYRLATDQNH